MIEEKMYKIVLLDLDNTLLNFDLAEKEAFKKITHDYDINYSDEIYMNYKKVNEEYWSKFEKGLIRKERLVIERFEEVFKNILNNTDFQILNSKFLNYLSEIIFYEDNALSILEYLHAKYRVIIVTNGVIGVQEKRLKISGINKYIDGVVYSEEAGFNKPRIEYFEFVFKKYNLNNLSKKDFIIIGDSLESDIKGANNLKIDCIWYNSKNINADFNLKISYIIKDLKEIKKIL